MTYGLGTRSYNRSTEARRNKLERKAYMAKVEAGEITFPQVEVPVTCTCAQRSYAHELSIHRGLRYESRHRDGSPVVKWPWTLRFLGDMADPVLTNSKEKT